MIYYYLSIAERAPLSTDDHLKSVVVNERVLFSHGVDAQLPNRLRLHWQPRYRGPYFEILRTCRQAHDEAANMFYTIYPVEIQIRLSRLDFVFTSMPVLTISRIRDLRILVIVPWAELKWALYETGPWHGSASDTIPPTGSVRLRRLLEKATRLRSLQVAVQYVCEPPDRLELDSERLQRLLFDVTEGIPKQAIIKWGFWDPPRNEKRWKTRQSPLRHGSELYYVNAAVLKEHATIAWQRTDASNAERTIGQV